jgi:hypothetical protein
VAVYDWVRMTVPRNRLIPPRAPSPPPSSVPPLDEFHDGVKYDFEGAEHAEVTYSSRAGKPSQNALDIYQSGNFPADNGPATNAGLQSGGIEYYVLLALSCNSRLLEVRILIENDQSWDDRKIVKEMLQAYWEARGPWKKYLSMWGIWPWLKLSKIRPKKVCRLVTTVLTRLGPGV